MHIPEHHEACLKKVGDGELPLLRDLYVAAQQFLTDDLLFVARPGVRRDHLITSKIRTDDGLTITRIADKATGWFVQLVKKADAIMMTVGRLSAQEHVTETGSVFNFWTIEHGP
jgi:hypothetical protein